MQPQNLLELLNKQVKRLISSISDRQSQEQLILYESLGGFMQCCAQVIMNGPIFNEKTTNTALYALYRIVSTSSYNKVYGNDSMD